jgi:hypothetical protein
MNASLRPDRVPGIIQDLKDHNAFHCHKTIDYNKQFDDDGEFIPDDSNQLCAGSLLYMEKAGIWNRPVKLAEHFGLYDSSKMHGHELIIDVIEGDETDDKI